MPPKRGGRGGAVKRTTPVKTTPEETKKEENAEVKEEKEEKNIDDMQVMDEVKEEEANGDGGEGEEGEGEEGGEENEGEEAGEGGEGEAADGEKKEEDKDEKKEGDAKDAKKEVKKKPRFNPHNRTVAVHEYHVDRMSNVHDRTVMIGPTNLDDLQNEKLISYLTNNAVQFFIRYACKPDVKGHVEIRFKTAEEAKEAAEDLQTIREGLIANQNNEEFQGTDKAKELKNLWGSHDEGSAAQRTLVLKGLPKDVTLEQLEEKIPDATQIIMPHRGSPATFPGFCYVEFPTNELVEKKMKDEEKLKFPDPENTEEEKDAVFKKFDQIPHSDLLIKKIDTQHFDKSFLSIPGDAKQEMLNQFISACAYFERNSFLLRQKRLETIKKKKQMLIARRDEIRKMMRAQNKRNRNMRGGRPGGRGGSQVATRGGSTGGAAGRGVGRPDHRGGSRGGGHNNDRRPMKRFNERSPRGGGGGYMGGKRPRRDSYGRGDDRGPMPTGPRIPRDAWQNNSWNNGGGMGGGNFNNSGMGGGMGGGGGGNFGGSGYMGGSGMGGGGNMRSDVGSYSNSGSNMGRMDYNNSSTDYYDDGMRTGGGGSGSMGLGGNSYSAGGGGGYSSNVGEYEEMGQDSYGAGGAGGASYGGGAGSTYNDGYDSYSTSTGQGRKGSLNPQQAANAVNLLVGLSSLMGNKNQSGGATGGGGGGGRFGSGSQKGGRWGGGRN